MFVKDLSDRPVQDVGDIIEVRSVLSLPVFLLSPLNHRMLIKTGPRRSDVLTTLTSDTTTSNFLSVTLSSLPQEKTGLVSRWTLSWIRAA